MYIVALINAMQIMYYAPIYLEYVYIPKFYKDRVLILILA